MAKTKNMHLTRGAKKARKLAELELSLGTLVVDEATRNVVRGNLYNEAGHVANVALSHLYGGTWEVEFHGYPWFDQEVYKMTDLVTVTSGFLNACDVENEQGDYLFFSKKGVVAF